MTSRETRSSMTTRKVNTKCRSRTSHSSRRSRSSKAFELEQAHVREKEQKELHRVRELERVLELERMREVQRMRAQLESPQFSLLPKWDTSSEKSEKKPGKQIVMSIYLDGLTDFQLGMWFVLGVMLVIIGGNLIL
jgi:polynucleotide 5'-kinase involved in rRNA processing